jgi:hypothetical protein
MTAPRLLLCALLLLPPAAAPATDAPAGQPAAFAEVMALLAARTHGRVAFTEVHELAVLKKPVRSSGELVYLAPDRLEKRTLEPKAETLVLDHGVLSAQRGRHTYTMALAEAPQVLPFVESVRATLAGDAAALERYFSVEFTGDTAAWHMSLRPRQAAVAAAVSQITMDGTRDVIHTVDIREKDGDRSLLTLGPELPP